LLGGGECKGGWGKTGNCTNLITLPWLPCTSFAHHLCNL